MSTLRGTSRRARLAIVVVLVLATVGFGVSLATRNVSISDTDPGPTITTTASSAPRAPVRAELRRARNEPLKVSEDRVERDILRLSYRAEAGDSRLIAATISIRQPPRSSPRRTGALLTITCSIKGQNERSTASIENVERGEILRQSPRMVYRAPVAGVVTCTITVRPFFGEADVNTGVARVDVMSGSYVVAGELQPAWAREWTFDQPTASGMKSELLAPGQSFMQQPTRTFTLPDGTRRVEIQSDHKVTNCFFKGGSSDSTTPLLPRSAGQKGRERQDLCPHAFPEVPRSTVRVFARLTRLDARGHPCEPGSLVLDATSVVSGEAHHARINSSVVTAVPTGKDCINRFALTSWVRNEDPPSSGMDLVVHATDERLAVLDAGT